jgi:hypothetical protein|tara:strand:- start:470 stop:628 length:159 start_codon:yes stop_codon:yes gene_type:complete
MKPSFYMCMLYNVIDIAAAIVGLVCLGFWKPSWTFSVMGYFMKRSFGNMESE